MISAVQPLWDLILSENGLITLQIRVVSCHCKGISPFGANVGFRAPNLIPCLVGQVSQAFEPGVMVGPAVPSTGQIE